MAGWHQIKCSKFSHRVCWRYSKDTEATVPLPQGDLKHAKFPCRMQCKQHWHLCICKELLCITFIVDQITRNKCNEAFQSNPMLVYSDVSPITFSGAHALDFYI